VKDNLGPHSGLVPSTAIDRIGEREEKEERRKGKTQAVPSLALVALSHDA